MRSTPRPPELATKFFRWYCGDALVDDLIGDMDEIFVRNAGSMPPWRAKVKYWLQVISLVTSYAIKKRRQRTAHHPYSKNAMNFHMVKNYFLIAWRMMTRNKMYTLINVLGLTLGICACLIVFLVVSHEFSFDKFHPDHERIYRLRTIDSTNNWECTCVPAPGYVAVREYTNVEAITGYHHYDAKTTVVDNGQEKRFERNTASIIITDPDYFKIFRYDWIAGNSSSLAKPLQVVLTESRAKTYFGSAPPHDIIGKAITYNDSLNVTVGGIVKDWKENSDFKQTEFISFSTIENTFLRKDIHMDSWGELWHSSQGFVKLKPDESPEEIAAQLSKINANHGHNDIGYRLEKLADVHFRYDEGIPRSSILNNLYALSGLAVFILIIASINFINLSTAQSISRAREIGIRKVMGSMRFQIVVQFLSETMVVAFLAMCLGVALVRPLLLAFSSYIPSGITFDPMSGKNWLFIGALLLVISILAGSYPALMMSSHKPAAALSGRGSLPRSERWSLRKVLIVFQFSFSLFFIIATLVISSQMSFIQTRDRGLSTGSVITFRTNWKGEVSRVKTLADRLRALNGVGDVTMQATNAIGFAKMFNVFEYEGANGLVKGDGLVRSADEHFVPVYKIRLIAGKNIKAGDSLTDIVINETMAKKLGFDDPADAVGEHIKYGGKLLPVSGVAKDFLQGSFREKIEPCFIANIRDWQHALAIRLDDPDLVSNGSLVATIESEFKELYPDEPFEYHFIEEEIGWMHSDEQKTAKLAAIAMGITIFISCMGVFGLAMFTTTMRTREIGIRKVLGASVPGIVNMLSREFMILIIVSIVLTTPVAWYYMNDWLLGFTFRTTLNWWFFIAAGLIALATGLITVSFQSFKAANTDPVKALKVE